jgi:isoleucyl-tRNA synthetase
MYEKSNKMPDLPEMELEILDLWKKTDAFKKLIEKNKNKEERWSFLDGPITANNPMGVHHAWGRSYKDMFQRYHAMKGHKQRYQNGFDCQGLWVEVEVEKELGFKSKTDIEKFGIENFVAKCKNRVLKYSEIIRDQSIRLGMWMDWDNSYFTMSDINNYNIWLFLKKCHERGFIYKGKDVMPWCIDCGSSLSEHEIATEGYKDRQHPSIYIKVPIKDMENTYLMIWTTTPWTLPANVAAAVHPDFDYVKIKSQGEFLYIVKSRLSIIQQEYEIVEDLKGENLVGLKYNGPFAELPAQNGVDHKIIPWNEVSESDGTGVVHIAPGCGKEDFELGKEFNLPSIAPLDPFGTFIDGFDFLTGIHVKDINKPVYDSLRKKNYLYKIETLIHRYPVCWRHGSDLVFRLVDEWFISMDEVRFEIMEVAKKIRWIPDWGLDRELDWLRNMHDWMISKKRFWGLALPIFECEKCGHFDVIGGIEELKDKAVSGWKDFEGHSPHKPWIDNIKIKCEKCGELVPRIKDVGNPWLDAGIVSFSTMGYLEDKEYWNQWFPADFITECFPGQFRNWFYSLLAMSTILENREPFKILLGHSLVKDEKGEDMHKSAGNAIEFNEAAQKIGSEVMRYIFASQNPIKNLNFGFGMAREIVKKLLSYWNVYSFYITYAEIDNFKYGDFEVPYKERNELDRWIISKTQKLIENSHTAFNEYSLFNLMKYFEQYIDDLSNWYLRRSRRRFWKSEFDEEKKSAFATLSEVLFITIKLFAPILPFLTEKMYQNMIRNVLPDSPVSIHLNDYPVKNSSLIDDNLEARVDTAIDVVNLGRSARNSANLKIRQPLAEIIVVTSDEIKKEHIKVMKKQILEELNIKKINFDDNKNNYSSSAVKLNFANVGKKYGKLLKQIQSTMGEDDTVLLTKAVKLGETIFYNIESVRVELLPEDVFIETAPSKGFAIAESEDILVAIRTKLTEELINEGIARDLVRHIQNFRKEIDLDVSDRIQLYYKAEEEVSNAIQKNKEYIMSETLSTEMVEAEDFKDISTKEIKIQDTKLIFGIKK